MDPRVHGVTLEALVAVRLAQHTRNAIGRFEQHVVTLPEVRGVFHLTGANDYLVHVAVRDAEHLREFVLSAFAARPEVGHLETSLIFSHRSNPGFGTQGTQASRDPGSATG